MKAIYRNRNSYKSEAIPIQQQKLMRMQEIKKFKKSVCINVLRNFLDNDVCFKVYLFITVNSEILAKTKSGLEA